VPPVARQRPTLEARASKLALEKWAQELRGAASRPAPTLIKMVKLSEGGFVLEDDPPPAVLAPALAAPPPARPPPPARAGTAGPAAAPTPTPPPGGACARCACPSVSLEFWAAFRVLLCAECKRAERLLSKTAAAADFGLAGGDLRRLGSVQRTNPRGKSWAPMQLFLASQVEAAAHAKHGGAAGVAARQAALLDARLQARLRRREEERTAAPRAAERLRRVRQRIADAGAAAPPTAPLAADDEEQI
jgi:hypothetical protein